VEKNVNQVTKFVTKIVGFGNQLLKSFWFFVQSIGTEIVCNKDKMIEEKQNRKEIENE
jgi:hypothetical protein